MRYAIQSRNKPQSFNSCCRLKNRADFNKVFCRPKAQIFGNGCLTIRGCPNDGEARLGIIVSRKTAHRAVDRNRIKRLIRESFRRRRTQLPAADFVVVGHGAIAGLSRPRLNQRLHTSWHAALKKYKQMHSARFPTV